MFRLTSRDECGGRVFAIRAMRNPRVIVLRGVFEGNSKSDVT